MERVTSGRLLQCMATALVLAAGACKTRLYPEDTVVSVPPCPDTKPTCVAAPDGCEAAATVEAICDRLGHAWSCPQGARPYAHAPDVGAAVPCLPFRHATGIAAVGSWGLSSLARVPTDDGRCLWISDSATLPDGSKAENVALEPDRSAPFGTCPAESLTLPRPVVTMEGGDDPSILVQIDGGYRLCGATHVLYRLFRSDANSPVGVTELGGGIGRWDGAAQRIVIPDPKKPFPWGLDLDLGDANLAAGDGLHAFAFGCARPGLFLQQGCELARLDGRDGVELLGAGGAFLPTVRADQGVTLFGSGTWISSVVAVAGGLRHVFIVDFGGELASHTAVTVTGPWSDGPGLGACRLPAADAKAFCAGPVVHMELADPTRPGELPVSYAIGSTGRGTGNRDDYWTHLVWVN